MKIDISKQESVVALQDDFYKFLGERELKGGFGIFVTDTFPVPYAPAGVTGATGMTVTRGNFTDIGNVLGGVMDANQDIRSFILNISHLYIQSMMQNRVQPQPSQLSVDNVPIPNISISGSRKRKPD